MGIHNFWQFNALWPGYMKKNLNIVLTLNERGHNSSADGTPVVKTVLVVANDDEISLPFSTRNGRSAARRKRKTSNAVRLMKFKWFFCQLMSMSNFHLRITQEALHQCYPVKPPARFS